MSIDNIGPASGAGCDAACTINLELDPAPADREVVIAGLRAHNRRFAPQPGWTPLTLLLRNTVGQVVGGLLGQSGWEWLHVEFIWVTEALRGQGNGKALLERAEAEARARGCRAVHLDTHDFQSPAFYEHFGYRVFGVLQDYPPGFRRYFLERQLVGKPEASR